MNKELVSKIMQAKRLEYQAVKEILPENLADRLTKVEGDLMEAVKDCIFSEVMGKHSGTNSTEEGMEKKTHKVTVE